MSAISGFLPADRAMFSALQARVGDDQADLAKWVTPPTWRRQQHQSDRQVDKLRSFLQDEALEKLGWEELALLPGSRPASGPAATKRRGQAFRWLRRLSRLLSPPPVEQLESLRLTIAGAGLDPHGWLKPAGLHRLARRCLGLDRTQVNWLAGTLSLEARRSFLATYERLRLLVDLPQRRPMTKEQA